MTIFDKSKLENRTWIQQVIALFRMGKELEDTTEALLENKQDTLIAGDNITIDDNVISAVAEITNIDSELSTTSTNAVQNKVITNKVNTIDGNITSLQSDVSTVTQEVNAVKPRVTTLETTTSNISSKIDDIEEDITEIDGEITTANQEISALKPRVTTLETNTLEIDDRVNDIDAEVGVIDTKVGLIETELPNLQPKLIAGNNISISSNNEISASVAGALVYKGTIQTYSDLPASKQIGWMYFVVADNKSYAWDGTQWGVVSGTITIDTGLSTLSHNPVENMAVTNAINAKQNTLEAGDYISIIGNRISAVIPAVTIDTQLSNISTNAVQNKVIKSAIDGKQGTLTPGYALEIDDSNNIDVVYDADTIKVSNDNELYVDPSALPSASSTTRGMLSSTDWNTFNGKQNSGDYATNTALTNGLATKQDTISTGTGITKSGNEISVNTSELPTAGATTRGMVTANDWNTFNSKQDSISVSGGITKTGNTISVDTSVIQPKLTAGTNITIDDNNKISAISSSLGNYYIHHFGKSDTYERMYSTAKLYHDGNEVSFTKTQSGLFTAAKIGDILHTDGKTFTVIRKSSTEMRMTFGVDYYRDYSTDKITSIILPVEVTVSSSSSSQDIPYSFVQIEIRAVS